MDAIGSFPKQVVGGRFISSWWVCLGYGRVDVDPLFLCRSTTQTAWEEGDVSLSHTGIHLLSVSKVFTIGRYPVFECVQIQARRMERVHASLYMA